MKKLILALFIIFGTLSFSNIKYVIGVMNDNYEKPVISGVPDNGTIANFILGLSKYGEVTKYMYNNLSNSDKVEFIIEKHEEAALVSVLKTFEKNKYKGQIKVTEIAATENKNIRQITTKNGWTYNIYSQLSELPGTVKIAGVNTKKGDFIKDLFKKLSKD